MRVAVLASGQGSNFEALATAIEAGFVEATITLVLADREAPVIQKARARGITTAIQPRKGLSADEHNDQILEILDLEDPDLVVLAGYMRILGTQVLKRFPGRVINIHPSLLPAFKGAHGVRDALHAGVGIIGCTTHIVTPDLDGGPIVLQAALAAEGVLEVDKDAVHALEHHILPRTVQLFAENRIVVVDGRAHISPGPSWKDRVSLVPGAVYAHGF